MPVINRWRHEFDSQPTKRNGQAYFHDGAQHQTAVISHTCEGVAHCKERSLKRKLTLKRKRAANMKRWMERKDFADFEQIEERRRSFLDKVAPERESVVAPRTCTISYQILPSSVLIHILVNTLLFHFSIPLKDLLKT